MLSVANGPLMVRLKLPTPWGRLRDRILRVVRNGGINFRAQRLELRLQVKVRNRFGHDNVPRNLSGGGGNVNLKVRQRQCRSAYIGLIRSDSV